MKACDVVTGLRAEVEQWRARAIQAEARGTAHDQIGCQRAELERLRSDLARVEAERDAALAAGKRLDHQQKGLIKQIDDLRREREAAECAQALAESLHRGCDHIARDVRAILANALGVRPEAHDLRTLARMVVDAKAKAEAEAEAEAACPATVPAGSRVVSADLWEHISALADAVREVPDAD